MDKTNLEKSEAVDPATEALMTTEPPLLMRREQLQSKFRNKMGDEEEEMEEGEVEKPSAKAKAKASAKAKAKASAKAKAKASAKAKAKASAKSKAKSKASAKSKAKRDAEEDEADGGDDSPAKKKGKAGDSKVVAFDGRVKLKHKTFARRYAPQDGLPLLRFQAIQETYEADVAPKVKKQSSFQDCVGWSWWVECRYAH